MRKPREFVAVAVSQLAVAAPIYWMARASGNPEHYLMPQEPFTYPVFGVVVAALAMSIEAGAVVYFLARSPTWRRCLAMLAVLVPVAYVLFPTMVDSGPFWGCHLIWQCAVTAFVILALAGILVRDIVRFALSAE